MLVSVIIPVAPSHYTRVQSAIDSIQSQTLKRDVEVILSYDPEKTGAAATRNRALGYAQGVFTVFLDADDTLHPQYLENALNAYKRGHYVYTDWVLNGASNREGELYKKNKAGMPLQIWSTGQTHLITCLIPTDAIWAVGGFDESLPTLEDEDLFLALHSKGLCGIRVAKPLVNYNRAHGISLVNNDSAKDLVAKSLLINQMDTLFRNRYREFYTMACSNCSTPKSVINQNEKKEGDVLAMPLYSPRKVRGTATGRIYPKTGTHQTLWVAPEDYKQMTGRFALVPDTDAISPDVETVRKLAEKALKESTDDDEIPVTKLNAPEDDDESTDGETEPIPLNSTKPKPAAKRGRKRATK